MDKPDISRLIEFHQMLLKFRAIDRKVLIPPANEKFENDAEHSYMLAMATWYLVQYFPSLDRDKAIRIALTHDLVEVHAGDTFSYSDAAVLSSKKEKESVALKQLQAEWPDFPELFDNIEDYKNCGSEEAKFVFALDKLVPSIFDYLGDGYAWHKFNITFDMFLKEKESKIPVSPDVYEYYSQLLQILNDTPGLFPKIEAR